MPEAEYRIDLWRKALSLFYQRKKPDWTGPFKTAGYAGLGPQGLKVEPKLMDGAGGEAKPDIVSASQAHWVALELTADENKPKKNQLDQYTKLDGSYLTSHGLPFIKGPPTILLARPKPAAPHADDGPHTLLLLGDTFGASRLDAVRDPQLRQALQAFVGQPLSQAPELRFTLLPEQKPPEVRKAIAASVLTIFHPGSPGLSVKDIVDQGLDELVHAIGIDARQRMEKAVEDQLSILLEKHQLSEYVAKEGRTYKSKVSDKVPHSRTLKKIQGLIQEWVKGSGFAAPLMSYDTPASKS